MKMFIAPKKSFMHARLSCSTQPTAMETDSNVRGVDHLLFPRQQSFGIPTPVTHINRPGTYLNTFGHPPEYTLKTHLQTPGHTLYMNTHLNIPEHTHLNTQVRLGYRASRLCVKTRQVTCLKTFRETKGVLCSLPCVRSGKAPSKPHLKLIRAFEVSEGLGSVPGPQGALAPVIHQKLYQEIFLSPLCSSAYW